MGKSWKLSNISLPRHPPLSSSEPWWIDIPWDQVCQYTSFGRLPHWVFANIDLQAETKILVSNAVVVSTLLYRCEVWVTYWCCLKNLYHGHQHYLWKILRIRWDDYCTNASLLSAAKSINIEAQNMKHQLRWAGHCVRMEDNHIPNQVFYCQLSHGKSSQGGISRTSWKHTSSEETDPASWEVLAEDRLEWRLTVRQPVTNFEEDSLEQEFARQLRRKVKGQQPGRATLPETNICHICGRACRALIRLISHLRTHSTLHS